MDSKREHSRGLRPLQHFVFLNRWGSLLPQKPDKPDILWISY
jgi:hypothetical protein